jgi:hypothetical protein
MKNYKTKKRYLPIKSIVYKHNNRFSSNVVVFLETGVFRLFLRFIGVTTKQNLNACFLLDTGCQKSTEKRFKYSQEHQGNAGLIVLCLPQERRNNDGIIDDLTTFFNRCLYSIYPYLHPIYSLKRGAYHE